MQWNIGGWVGAQLGCSIWMLIAGILSMRHDVIAAVIVIGLFIVVNLAGVTLWTRRESLSAYAGIQILLPIMGVGGIGAVYVLDRAGIYEAIQVGGKVSAWSTYVILIAVVAALMLMFYFQAGRKGKSGGDES